MQITSVEFRQIIADAMQIVRMDTLSDLGLLKDKITQRQAYAKYGETRVDTWEKRGLITSVKQKGGSSNRYYSRVKLEIQEKSEKYEK